MRHTVFDWLHFNLAASGFALIFYSLLVTLFISPKIRRLVYSVFILPQPTINTRISSLDSVRGIAASLVALAHIWYFCSPIFNNTQTEWWWFLSVAGNKAVPIFVILSGFLIYRSAKKIMTADDISKYINRRFLRIYPVYVFTVLLAFIFKQQTLSLSNVLSSMFMVRVITQAYVPFSPPPVWSLYVEGLFYLLIPIYCIVFRKNTILPSIILLFTFLLVDPIGHRELWLWKYFMLGILLSENYDYFANRVKEPVAILLFLIGLMLLMVDFKITQSGSAYFDWFDRLRLVPKNSAEYTVGLGLGCYLLMLGLLTSHLVSSIFSIRPFRMLAAISYSLYLSHPFFILAVFPALDFSLVGTSTPQHLIDTNLMVPAWYLPFIMYPGALVVASVCFILIERPFLLLGRKKTELSLIKVDQAESGLAYDAV